jgi:hypothetical protein
MVALLDMPTGLFLTLLLLSRADQLESDESEDERGTENDVDFGTWIKLDRFLVLSNCCWSLWRILSAIEFLEAASLIVETSSAGTTLLLLVDG